MPGHAAPKPVVLGSTQLSTSQGIHARRRLHPSPQVRGAASGAVREAAPGLVSGCTLLNRVKLVLSDAHRVVPVSAGRTPALGTRVADAVARLSEQVYLAHGASVS